jgi:hypothetical protein
VKETCIKRVLSVCAVFLLIVAYGCTALKKAPDGTAQNKEDQELLRIERFKENVRRDGDTIYIKIESGAYLAFQDAQSCEPPSPCDYEFVDYYSDLGFYLIFVGYYEGEDYVMISDKDGKEYSVKDLPRLSPDRERLVSVSACGAFCINGVFVWRIVDGGLVSELFYEPEEYARYSFIKWMDNKTIELTKEVYSSEQTCPESDFMMVPVALRMEEGGWKFYDDLGRRDIECDPARTGSTPSR